MDEKVLWSGKRDVWVQTDMETLTRAMARFEGLVWDLLPAQERVNYEANAEYLIESLLLEGACVDRSGSAAVR